jgi:hypothetical protein
MLTLFISPALAADGNTLPDTGSVFSPASWTTDKLRLAIQAEDSSDVMSELAVKALVQREYEGKMLTTFMVNPDEVGRLVALLAKSFPDIQTAQSLDVPVELQNAIGKVFINAALPVDLLVQPAEKPESSDLLKIRPEPAAIRSVVESMGPQKAATYLKNIALVHGDGERFVHYVFEANQADIVYLAALLDKYYPGIWKVLRVDPKVLIDLQVPQVQSHQ